MMNAAKNTVSISAKCDPYFEEEGIWIIPKTPNDSNTAGIDDSGLPIPPKGLLWGGSYKDVDEYLSFGREHFENMRRIVETSDFSFEDGYRILDFGCAGGRMIRHFKDISQKCEIWGTDVSQACIIWCQQYLSPPFNFFTTTSFPYLPFEDGYFNFIYAGSVFTHIPVLEDLWLLELKRLLRPGGKIYITVHDKHTMKISIDQKNRGEKYKFGEDICQYEKSDFGMLVLSSSGYQKGFDSQVFYDIDFICQKWGHILNVISITPEAYGDQTAILLSK